MSADNNQDVNASTSQYSLHRPSLPMPVGAPGKPPLSRSGDDSKRGKKTRRPSWAGVTDFFKSKFTSGLEGGYKPDGVYDDGSGGLARDSLGVRPPPKSSGRSRRSSYDERALQKAAAQLESNQHETRKTTWKMDDFLQAFAPDTSIDTLLNSWAGDIKHKWKRFTGSNRNAGSLNASEQEQAPWSEAVEVDVELDPIEAIHKYSKGTDPAFLEKQLAYIDGIGAAASSGDTSVLLDLVALTKELLVHNFVEVRLAAIQECPALCKELLVRQNGKHTVELMSSIATMLPIGDEELQEVALEAYGSLCKLIDVFTIGHVPDVCNHIVTKIESLLALQTVEGSILAVKLVVLLQNLTPHATDRSLTDLAVNKFSHLLDAQDLAVREVAVSQLVHFCEHLPEERRKSFLFDSFMAKCYDSVWSVRKECANIAPQVSSILKGTNEQDLLLAVFRTHLCKDVSSWVATASLKKLGEFIGTLPPGKVCDTLVTQFVETTTTAVGASDNAAQELACACTLSFGVMCKSVGNKYWNLLSPCCDSILSSRSVPVLDEFIQVLPVVLSSVTLSQEQCADIIDKAMKLAGLVSASLAPILHSLLQSVPESVHYSILQRIDVLVNVEEVDQVKGYRARLVLAQQLDRIAKVVSPALYEQFVFPVALRLCKDGAWAVRRTAGEKFGKALHTLKVKEQAEGRGISYSSPCYQEVLGLATGKNYRDRQVFVTLALAMLKHEADLDEYEHQIVSALEVLVQDSCVKDTLKVELKTGFLGVVHHKFDNVAFLRPVMQRMPPDRTFSISLANVPPSPSGVHPKQRSSGDLPGLASSDN